MFVENLPRRSPLRAFEKSTRLKIRHSTIQAIRRKAGFTVKRGKIDAGLELPEIRNRLVTILMAIMRLSA